MPRANGAAVASRSRLTRARPMRQKRASAAVPGNECLCIPSRLAIVHADRGPLIANRSGHGLTRVTAVRRCEPGSVCGAGSGRGPRRDCAASYSAGTDCGYGQVRGQLCHSFLRGCISCRCRCSALVQGAEGNRFIWKTGPCSLTARAPAHAARCRTRALRNGRHLPDAAPGVFARDPDAEGSSESRPARWRGYWLRLVHLRVHSACAHRCGGGAYGRGVASSLV
jgi:hypothetical protein